MKWRCSMMFKYAIDQEIVTTNYASLVELPKVKPSKIHKPFTRQEQQILWQNIFDVNLEENFNKDNGRQKSYNAGYR